MRLRMTRSCAEKPERLSRFVEEPDWTCDHPALGCGESSTVVRGAAATVDGAAGVCAAVSRARCVASLSVKNCNHIKQSP